MWNLENQSKKLLRAVVAEKTMEYLMGLNEKNKPTIRRMVDKSARKIVTAYYQAIKEQHKKALRQTAKNEKENEVVTVAEPVELREQAKFQSVLGMEVVLHYPQNKYQNQAERKVF